LTPAGGPSEITLETVREQAVAAARAAAEKKAFDVAILEVGPILVITDFFVIASGANERQVRTIVDEVEKQLKEGLSLQPLRVEGLPQARWVLLDYGDFWVHVFHEETRAFYDLERLWSDAPRVEFAEAS
jgi:ribosome-associated protein